MSEKRAEFTVTGFVQGVGYRYYVYRWANQLNLKGYARNLYDGNVQVVVEGDSSMIEELHKQLRIGPSHSSVASVFVDYSDTKNEFKGFQIR